MVKKFFCLLSFSLISLIVSVEGALDSAILIGYSSSLVCGASVSGQSSNSFDRSHRLPSNKKKSPMAPRYGWDGSSMVQALALSGGESTSNNNNVQGQDERQRESLKQLFWKRTVALWGILQVVSIMANAVKRLLPIAIQPFEQNDLQPFQWAMYAAWVLYMGYTEGYQAFQQKFSPLIVKRAFSLDKQGGTILNYMFAGPFAMGMFKATKQRKIVTWGITVSVFALVKIVKKLPYPYRSIIDGGVVIGLSYGTLSILWQTIRGFCGVLPQVDPCFPES